MEVGGRWDEDAYRFLEQLAWARARDVPAALRRPTALAWLRKWTTQISVATLRSLADSLLHGTSKFTGCPAGDAPDMADLLALRA